MDRYWESHSATAPPPVPASNPGGYPTDGDPVTGVTPTTPGQYWYHMLTEELRNALVSLGVVPDYTKTDQLGLALLAALQKTAQSIDYNDLLNKPNLAKVATSGQYADLLNQPSFAAVATSGQYADLLGKPAIPAAQVNADWNATSGVAMILNKPPAQTIPPPTGYVDYGYYSGAFSQTNTSGHTATYTFSDGSGGGNEYELSVSVDGIAVAEAADANPQWSKRGAITVPCAPGSTVTCTSNPYNSGPGNIHVVCFVGPLV